MKHIAFVKQSLVLFVGVLTVLLTGCIKEDLADCNRLTLVVVNVEGREITQLGEVTKASLFVFDENKKLLEKRSLDKEFIINKRTIELNYPADKKLTIVAWGNLGDQNQLVSEVKTIEDLNVMLRSQNSLAQAPDTLYFGNKQVVTSVLGVAGGNQEIVIAPKVSSIRVETVGLEYGLQRHGLKSLKSSNEFDFYMNRTKSGFDYNGHVIGDSVYYNPDGVLVNTEWQMQKSMNVCTGENLTFSIDVNGVELAAVSEGTNRTTGETGPFKAEAGVNTWVQIQFDKDGYVSARVKVTPWGTVDSDIDF